jgi:hypothetical protein
MNFIVDSSVWIDSFKYLCPIIYQEVLQGVKEDKA